MQIVKISSKNQVTFPQEFLDLVGTKKGARLLLEVEGKKIVARPIKNSIVDQLSGALIVKPSLKGIPFEEVLKETQKIVAKKLARD